MSIWRRLACPFRIIPQLLLADQSANRRLEALDLVCEICDNVDGAKPVVRKAHAETERQAGDEDRLLVPSASKYYQFINCNSW